MSFSNFFDLYMREREDELQRGGVEFRYAAAALLLACANADLDESWEEKAAIRELLAETFAVSDDALGKLFDFAYEARQGTYIEELTDLISKGFPSEDKQFILQNLWKVALADGIIEPSEETFIQQATLAIGMTEQDSAQARARAEEEFRDP